MRTLLFASLALMLPLSAIADPFQKPLQKTCAQLQSDGWTPQREPLTNKPMRIETDVPGVVYMCMLAKVLPTKSSAGHAPDLQALLTTVRAESRIILSANIWCGVDRIATFDALAKQFERIAGKVPEPISAAIRAGQGAKITADGLYFEVAPVDVEPTACEAVPADRLGPVLMTIDVQIKPAKK